MKIRGRFKLILFISLFLLYGAGVATWILQTWFRRSRGFGPEPIPAEMWFLRTHSISGLAFLVVLGYLLHSHVLRGIKSRKKMLTGLSLLSGIAVVLVTVPFLFYAVDEGWKNAASVIHTYLGLALGVIFFLHLWSKSVRST